MQNGLYGLPDVSPVWGLHAQLPNTRNLQDAAALAACWVIRFIQVDRTDLNDNAMQTEGTATKAAHFGKCESTCKDRAN